MRATRARRATTRIDAITRCAVPSPLAGVEFPSVSPHFAVRSVPGEGLFFVSEHGAEVFVGQIFECLVPLLTGMNPIDSILDRLSARFPPTEILYALELLNRHGCLRSDAGAGGLSLSGRHSVTRANLAKRSIRVRDYTGHGADDLVASLADGGVHDLAAEPLVVGLVEDYLDPALAELNEQCLKTGSSWVLAKPVGAVLWIGPMFIPGLTACWECLLHRLKLNRRVARFIEAKTGERLCLPPLSSPSIRRLFVAMFTIELDRLLVREPGAEPMTAVLTFDTVARCTERHPVTRRPQCRWCGCFQHGVGAIRLDQPPIRHRDGGFRSEHASATFEALKRHISPISGVVSHVTRVNTGNDAIHVYVAGQNHAIPARSLPVLERSLRGQSSGKGTTDAQARTSAVCEAIERYASMFQGYEDHVVASLEELGPRGIHPNDCMLFSETQYTERRIRDKSASHFAWIPRPLQNNERLWWSPVTSLLDGATRYLPTAHVYFHSEELADPVGTAVCMVDSNGNAAGRTMTEAILQGLLELVERDATALWWYPRCRLPGVALASYRSEFVDNCLEHHASLGRDLWVLDATSDLRVPSFAAISRRRTAPEQIIFGFGCHVDATVALHRALGELNQLLVGVDSFAKARGPDGDATSRWLQHGSLATDRHLEPDRTARESRRDDYPSWDGDTVGALHHCVHTIGQAGLDVLAIDLTRPDIELTVVKVICPGLRHFWARLAPGRLYEVPVAMGRVSRQLAENELNPIAMFL
jgi:bacteriocin biosynthesis cyclodehydratase domain-containing protein